MIAPLLAALLSLAGSNVVLDDVYYGVGPEATDPLHDEHVLDVIFPAGTGPLSKGYASDPRPVVVYVRGGEFNKLLSDPASLEAPLTQSILKAGFVYVEPSYAELDTAAQEPHIHATIDIARAIQFVRSQHADWNIDPRKVVVWGHSGGALLSFDVGLRWDYQDLASPDPVVRHSSRPDAVVAWGATTDFMCFFKKAPALTWYFEVSDWASITDEQKIDESATHWLADPASYGRTTTPPIALLYNLDYQFPCGAILNPHDGTFGLEMMDAMLQFDATQGPECKLAEDALLLNIGPITDDETNDQGVAWVKKLYPDVSIVVKHR